MSYSPTGIKIQFGGSVKRGTFSDLFTSFPTTNLKYAAKNFESTQDNTDSVLQFHQTRFTVSTGTLLSMIPEIREYYYLITKKRSRTHPVDVNMASNARGFRWEFQIGDGEVKPNSGDVKQAFNGFDVSEGFGRLIVQVPTTEMHKIKASIFVDVRGRFWYVENPFFPVVLPELCVHFLLINTFSNLMRYSPDRWGNMLLNEVNSGISLIARKYLSAFENKFPTLILREISRFFPFISQ